MSLVSSMDARRRGEVLASVDGALVDLVVVGGGINGAGIARDAALRGLKVVLLEQRDLAFGTSSRSSKLIHGGLRYLEHYHFRLVFEGTNERAMLRKLAPHLVRPMLFALPVYDNSRHPLWKIQVGMWMYDGLALFKAEHRHVALRSAKRLLEREPLLRAEGLTGGIIYYDCVTDDARLTLENAIGAVEAGAPVLTRAQVIQIDGAESPGPAEVMFRDGIRGTTHRVRAKAVLNATGAWTDRVRRAAEVDSALIRPTKGVHLVIPRERLDVRHAVSLMAPQDGRVFFTIPWNGRTVIGTTDTDDRTDPSELRIDAADVGYLLTAVNHAFPSGMLEARDVIAGWAGLRPLIHQEAEHASDVSREHQIFRDGKLLSLAGGKLTTYRRMAKEAVDAAVEVIGAACQESSTEQLPLPGAVDLGDLDELAADLSSAAGLPEDVGRRLANVYGSRAFDLARLAQDDRALRERLDPERPVIWAEVVHAIDHELAMSVEDILVRRTSLALTARDQGRGAAERIAEMIGQRLGWDAALRRKSVEEFLHTADLAVAFRRQPAAGPAERAAG